MQAWFERVAPTGRPIDLPDGKATLVFGRSPRATLVFDDARVSNRHVEVSFDGAFWRARDLGTETGTRVNASPISYPRALFHGDLLEFGDTRLRFQAQPPEDNSALLGAIAAQPAAPEPYLVYADWLLERGDALGERIVQAHRGGRLDHHPWLGPLWEPYVSGELELDFHLGFIREASLRRVPGRDPSDWLGTVSTLCNTRVAKVLQRLAIDLPAFHLDAAHGLAALQAAQGAVARLPALPRTIAEVSFGYLVRPHDPRRVPVAGALAERLPALAQPHAFTLARSAGLRLEALEGAMRLVGLADGLRRLEDLTRVRRAGKDVTHFETPPGIPFITDGNPCFFCLTEGRWRLVAGRLKGELRVNGRVDASYLLLPGDLVTLQGVGAFRFELLP